MVLYDKRAIKRFMVEKRVDLDYIAERTQLARNTIRYLSLGMTEPKASTLAKIANVLEMPIEAFFRAA